MLIDQNGNRHSFIANTDGTSFVAFGPQDGKSSYINGFSPDGKIVWGAYVDKYGNSFGFATKTNSNIFLNLISETSSFSISGYTPDGRNTLGNYTLNNQNHSFVIKNDFGVLIDLAPKDAIGSYINGLTSDGDKAWGYFIDQNNYGHPFITKLDGTGFVDLTPKDAILTTLGGIGISPDGKIFGTYQTADLKWHGFTYQT